MNQQNSKPKNNSKPKTRSLKIIFFTFIISVFILASFSIGYLLGLSAISQNLGTELLLEETPELKDLEVDFDLFWQTWNHIKQNYVEQDITDEQLFYGALAGIVASLQDPYSIFLEPETAEKFNEELSGSFEGIGAEIGIKKNQLTIIAPLPNTPADRAGLRAGDKVLAIDELDARGISLDFAVSKIRGPKGTKVTLTIVREGVDEPFEVEIIRDTIDIPSVRWEMKEGQIAYIDLMYFNGDTLDEFKKAVKEIVEAKPKGIILDLRNNPGGFLGTAIEVAGEWIEDEVVVYEKRRDDYQLSHKARGRADFKNIPTVVLVNIGSASGSEIVAGALQDYQKATIVGEQTFGKGSVQDLKRLKDGSSIKLTVAEWLTPSGRNINEEGIAPDVEVELTKDDYDNDRDPQLDKALELLQ